MESGGITRFDAANGATEPDLPFGRTRSAEDKLEAPPRNRLRLGIGAGIILVLLFFVIAVVVSMVGSHGSTQSLPVTQSSAIHSTALPVSSSTSGPQGTLYVHILGAVAKPGLYLLRTGDRAVDAVGKAGGFTAAADRSTVNLARLLVDGEQIVVAEVGAAPASAASAATGAAAGAGTPAGGKVNLNTANETSLETLPHVGPALGKRIIDWRTKNGRFTTIQDLMSVTGVGEKTFADLKDFITV